MTAKVGRPPKEKTGKNVFVPAEILDFVMAIIETFRKQQAQNQQAQP